VRMDVSVGFACEGLEVAAGNLFFEGRHCDDLIGGWTDPLASHVEQLPQVDLSYPKLSHTSIPSSLVYSASRL
jgi:hypothetical protein